MALEAWSLGLTARDTGLRSASTRDPLGFEIIWTTFGGQAIPALSTVSRGMASFCALVAHTWCVDTWLEQTELTSRVLQAHSPIRLRLMMALESLHAFAVASTTSPGDPRRRNLPGIDSAAALLADHDTASLHVGLDAEHDVLVNQPGMGINGRYRRPLMNAREPLLDEHGHLHPHPADARWAMLRDDYAELREEAWRLFDALTAARAFRVPLDDPAARALMEQSVTLRDMRRNTALAAQLTEAFGLHLESGTLHRALFELLDPAAHNDAARLYRQALDHIDSEAFRDTIADAATRAEHRAKLNDVIALEEILWRVDVIFDRLWQRDLSPELFTVEGPAGPADLLAELGERREDLARLRERARRHRSNALKRRLEALARLLDQTDDWLGFLQFLVHTLHAEVVIQGRSGSTPWVALEGRRARVLNGGHSPAPDRLGWRRSYYIPTLVEFCRDARLSEAEPGGEPT